MRLSKLDCISDRIGYTCSTDHEGLTFRKYSSVQLELSSKARFNIKKDSIRDQACRYSDPYSCDGLY